MLLHPDTQAGAKEFPEIRGYVINVGGGNLCVGGPSKYLVTNDAGSCLSLKADTIRDVIAVGGQVRAVTMTTKYHAPRPMAPDGALGSTIDSEVRFDCAERAGSFFSARMYDSGGKLVYTDTPASPRPMPNSEMAVTLADFVCSYSQGSSAIER